MDVGANVRRVLGKPGDPLTLNEVAYYCRKYMHENAFHTLSDPRFRPCSQGSRQATGKSSRSGQGPACTLHMRPNAGHTVWPVGNTASPHAAGLHDRLHSGPRSAIRFHNQRRFSCPPRTVASRSALRLPQKTIAYFRCP